MYNRRKLSDHGRVKRSMKKNKVCDALSSSYVQFLRIIMIWLVFMLFDFFLEFRFEYFWPCWLLLRSVNDSFKYQGLIFSLFFLFIALMSDVICYVFIPVTWIFFLGSYYVWIQLLWHTDRGVCFPTVALCIIFLYVEFTYRLREPKNLPFNIDLCRPFAAHCIGYPVVTLGFGFKSCISYRLKLRKQKDVQVENAFYMDLIDEALPEDCRQRHRLQDQDLTADGKRKQPLNGKYDQDDLEYCEQHQQALSSCTSSCMNVIAASTGSGAGDDDDSSHASISNVVTFASKSSSSSCTQGQASSVSRVSSKATSACSAAATLLKNGLAGGLKKLTNGSIANSIHSNGSALSSHTHHGAGDSSMCQTLALTGNGSGNSGSTQVTGSPATTPVAPVAPITNGHVANGSVHHSTSSKGKGFKGNKDDYSTKLESEVKRLKSELQSSRSCELEVRSQLTATYQLERTARMELEQARIEAEAVQNRVHNLVQRSQSDKSQVQQLEKKLSEERRLRQIAESQVAVERRGRREDQQAAASKTSAHGTCVAVQTPQARTECQEWCQKRRRELEADLKTCRRDIRARDERLEALLAEVNDVTHLRQRLEECSGHMNDLRQAKLETERLQQLLREENRIKQEMFTVFHATRKENSSLQMTLNQYEIRLQQLQSQVDLYKPSASNLADFKNLFDMASPGSGVRSVSAGHQSPLLPSSFHQGPYQQPPGLSAFLQHQTSEQHLFNHQDAQVHQLLGNLIGPATTSSHMQHPPSTSHCDPSSVATSGSSPPPNNSPPPAIQSHLSGEVSGGSQQRQSPTEASW